MSFIGMTDKEQITGEFGRHVSSGKVDFFRAAGIDFVMGRREGIYVWDLQGRQLIDCHTCGGVHNLGHRHPRLVAALQQALGELDVGNHHLISEARAHLARELAALSPGDINRVIFGVSGGEAIDMAIKLARGYTGRPTIVCARGGYHGHTGFALAAGEAQYAAPFAPLPPGFVHVPFDDIPALAAALDDNVAAVLLETIPATLGIVIPAEDYFSAVRRLCDRHGALLMVDEVQTGLGRCGAVWCIETFDVQPDIIVSGKGLSGGLYPLSATLYRDPLDAFLRPHPFIHVSTLGGAELGCHVTLEVLHMLQEPGFLDHVRSLAEHFAAGLAALQEKHPAVLLEVRQRGLMIGLKIAHESGGLLMSQAGYHAGLLVVYANNDPSVMQLLPPLVIRPDEADQVLERLDWMLSRVGAMLQGAPAAA